LIPEYSYLSPLSGINIYNYKEKRKTGLVIDLTLRKTLEDLGMKHVADVLQRKNRLGA
jgi:hypothetical protein